MNAAHRRTCSSMSSSQNGSPASRPVFTTSARPFPSSSSGSVARSAVSITVAAGQWNAPTRFLPCPMSMPTLPPIEASTCPTSVDGTATQSIPRMYVAATNPTRSVVVPPPSATSVEKTVDPQRLPQPFRLGKRLALDRVAQLRSHGLRPRARRRRRRRPEHRRAARTGSLPRRGARPRDRVRSRRRRPRTGTLAPRTGRRTRRGRAQADARCSRRAPTPPRRSRPDGA